MKKEVIGDGLMVTGTAHTSMQAFKTSLYGLMESGYMAQGTMEASGHG